MKKQREKQNKTGKIRSVFSQRYLPNIIGFFVMLICAAALVRLLNMYSLTYEPPVKREPPRQVFIEVLAPYSEKTEVDAPAQEEDEYEVNENVHADVATGDAKIDEDAKVAPVRDNSIGTSEVKPEVTRAITSVPGESQNALIYRSSLTPFTFATTESMQGWNVIGNNIYYITPDKYLLTGNQMIDNIRYYFNQRGARASLVGIDVSRHQGNIDWARVRASGVDFAIIRVGFRGYGEKGKLAIDDNFHKNIKGAIAAGIRVGLYFYSQAVNVKEAVDEASVAVQQAHGYNITFPIYCDTEFAQSDRSGRADRLDRRTRTDCVVAFCETVRKAGYTAGVYSSKSYYYGQLDFSRIKNYEIWLAHYTKNMTDFSFGYNVWQYTDCAHVDGIPDNAVDLNIAYYDYATRDDFSRWGEREIIFRTYQEFEPYYTAENMIIDYGRTKSQNDYNQTLEQVKSLGIDNVRTAYKSALEWQRLRVLAGSFFSNLLTTTEPPTEETTSQEAQE
jgi:GH25 family lysozyme M1 (1,4-beta-N-acetylmuramidase)